MSIQFFATINYWSWNRSHKNGKYIEDESYEWSNVGLDRRLGVRTSGNKYFIFFRKIRYKQREYNYWFEKSGGWRIKIPYCKTYEQQKIGNWILVDLPFYMFMVWFFWQFHHT